MFTKMFFVEGVEFTVEFSGTKYRPAKISGPPEKCHPAEGGEVEFETIYVSEFEVSSVLSDRILNELKSLCEDALPELQAEQDEQAMCDAAEARSQE